MAMAQPKPNDALVLRLSRSFAAPRDRVFRAFTAPAQLVKWWGPKGFTVPACTMDVAPAARGTRSCARPRARITS